MTRFGLLARTQLGKKAIVAVTGGLLLGFLLLHMAGNLKAFLPGPEPGVADIDVYSAFLRSLGEPLLPHGAALWAVRVVLGASLVLHVVCVFQLAAQNRRARPVRYERSEYVAATMSARWMLVTGSLLLVFVVVHLLHLTAGTLVPADFAHGAVYENLYRAFVRWRWVAFYGLALVVLALHLYHGAWSLFQSLGLDGPDRNRNLRRTALGLAILLPLAFASVPVAFFAGVLGPPPEETTHLAGGR